MLLPFFNTHFKFSVTDRGITYKVPLKGEVVIPYDQLVLADMQDRKMLLLWKTGQVDVFPVESEQILRACVSDIQARIQAAGSHAPASYELASSSSFCVIGSVMFASYGMFLGTDFACSFITPKSRTKIADYAHLMRVTTKDAVIQLVTDNGDTANVTLLSKEAAEDIAGRIRGAVQKIHDSDPDYQKMISGLLYYDIGTSMGKTAVCKIDAVSLEIRCGHGKILSMPFDKIAAVSLKTVPLYSSLEASLRNTFSKVVTDFSTRETRSIICMDINGCAITFETTRMEEVYHLLQNAAGDAIEHSEKNAPWKFRACVTYESQEMLLRADETHLELINKGSILKNVSYDDISEFTREESDYVFRLFSEEARLCVKLGEESAREKEPCLRELIVQSHQGNQTYQNNKRAQEEQDQLKMAADSGVTLIHCGTGVLTFIPSTGTFVYQKGEGQKLSKIPAANVRKVDIITFGEEIVIRLTCLGDLEDLYFVDFNVGSSADIVTVDEAEKTFTRIQNFVNRYRYRSQSSDRQTHANSQELKSTQFFSGCKTKSDLKERYRVLVKLYHPDNKTGSGNVFVAIDSEYHKLMQIYPD